jgi:hypothetical protein
MPQKDNFPFFYFGSICCKLRFIYHVEICWLEFFSVSLRKKMDKKVAAIIISLYSLQQRQRRLQGMLAVCAAALVRTEKLLLPFRERYVGIRSKSAKIGFGVE